MRVHYLQHVPFEGPAYIKDWIENKSMDLSCTALYQNQKLPSQEDFDCLMIMGGPMGVNDEKKYPWMMGEKKFIEQTIKQNKIVIGICLGAQLIADVLGAGVFPNQHKEIGWFPIRKISKSNLFDTIWPDEFYAFHWHGDMFEIPDGAIHFVESKACANQGFMYQENVFAFQFHLESTRQSIEQLILNCGHELKEAATHVQDPDTIRRLSKYVPDCNNILKLFLESILGNQR
ncbi:MAG: type 1 glutamine amidotransferase [Pseudomonadota bacterium]